MGRFGNFLDRVHQHVKEKYGSPPASPQPYSPPSNQPDGPWPTQETAPAFPPGASPAVARAGPQTVFAHFIVGCAAAMTPEQWESDIIEAQKCHIDGFALNIAPQDSYTERVLENAYSAAERVGDFTLFLSFDYGSGGPWPVDRVIHYINTFAHRSPQYFYEGRPLVSTFIGISSAGDWVDIKRATNCFFVPSWPDCGPAAIANYLDIVDGAFSWDAWPVGAEQKNTANDEHWMQSLAGRPYMMPVSPWFYTNLPQWDKNWLWRGDDLWHYRWEQVMRLQPAWVQIISWNDYGEAHYIGPIHEAGVPDGAGRYCFGHPHDAWRALLPHYIDAYRNGGVVDPNQPRPHLSFADKIVYWYRTNPSHAGSTNGTTGNNPGVGQEALHPGEVSQDRVFVSVIVGSPSEIHIQIGDGTLNIVQVLGAGVHHCSVPFDGETGPVQIMIVRNEQVMASATGPAITEECQDGNVNWNCYVGSSD